MKLCISQLRAALGDEPKAPRDIETASDVMAKISVKYFTGSH